MAAEFSVTTPGLLYDPRNGATAKFWAAVQKDLQSKLDASQASRTPSRYPQGSGWKPLPDPGRPVTGPFANPNFKVPKGYAIQV
jgi:hypothetical protein